MKSQSLKNTYTGWASQASPEQIEFVDSIYAMCEENYDKGGDVVTECMTPAEVLKDFNSLEDAKDYCGIKVEQATNCRWGEDDDPEIKRQNAFDTW